MGSWVKKIFWKIAASMQAIGPSIQAWRVPVDCCALIARNFVCDFLLLGVLRNCVVECSGISAQVFLGIWALVLYR